ncbi:polyamine ABC transporter ATP-binding protein [Phaeobacter gallaeciensis]|uniref:Spermidine/putrescine import ATP-binding protein PotA n=2 Tax=Roseobacteraceae TaxID=2854170 RepID=A0A366WW36_9RHOB|nr:MULTISPECIES: ABC transporter ATP-binding protein [Roseobacteraceae]MBT3143777.1 ABC transporter ATP-binding protein [Falsiruegeria litorea]MBT8169558.1 ABC transporter ATP-binding protein [Falsiruegeria litorea]RBW53533.1 polyamine ABC transporter ATP-binding protein [Phaeobacter gallaeciensis]
MTETGTVSETPWLDQDGQQPLVQIKGVTKKYGEVTAVDNVDLDIYQGELFCLLGGSGCGKSTLLRMLAGFEDLNGGSITIDGADMQDVPAYDRPTNMMFQSYALFPHMSVEQNIAFGLQQDKMARSEISNRVHDILTLVELQDFKKRKPQQLSGGQRQRVALARALVKEPRLLLLDEPLAALDKKLRKQTQFELANIQEKVGVTFIVVTHDQEEAMTLSTRMAVMDAGKFKQIGTPTEIYEFPESRFVADFIGSANVFEGRVTEDGADHVRVKTNVAEVFIDHGQSVKVGSKIWVALRPEKIRITKTDEPASGPNQVSGVVDDIGYLGEMSIYKIELPNGQIVDITSPNSSRPMNRQHRITWGDKVNIAWEPSSVMLLTE